MEINRVLFTIGTRLDEANILWHILDQVEYTKLWFSPIEPTHGWLYRLKYQEPKENSGILRLAEIVTRLETNGWQVRAARTVQTDQYNDYDIQVEFFRKVPNT